jgi:micrococcal nuclease
MKNLIFKFTKLFSLILVLSLAFMFAGCKEPEIEEPEIKEIDTIYTDELELKSTYVSKSFINNGIGEVRLSQTVDGDTAHFVDKSSGIRFTARFLCINTPESTGRIEPWGKEASKFVADILSSAEVIVLEAEKIGSPAELDTTGGRYLAYVWYKPNNEAKFRLLNLEIVEQCYSNFTGVASDSKYGEDFDLAALKSYTIKRRKFGEDDPNFDYSNEVKEITIAELRNNFTDYSSGTKLKITARVMRMIGDNLYVEDLSETWNETRNVYETAGIYMFSGYGSGLAVLNIGAIISFECQCVDNDTYGKQLTNPSKVKIIENASEFIIKEFSGKETIDMASYEGFVISIAEYKVTNVNEPDEEGAFTIYGKTSSGQSINIRIDGAVYPKPKASTIEIGATYSVIGGVSKFNKTFQIMIGNQKNQGLNDLIKK